MRRNWAVAGLLAVVCALAFYAIRQQQDANRQILTRLDDVRSTLRDQTSRSAALSDQVTALTERVGRLEADNRDLRRQIAALLRRKPVEVALSSVPIPLEMRPLAPLAEASFASAEPFILEPVPITWSADWSSYQPAGIIAPSAPIVLQRRLTNPAFVKKLYYGLGALQAADAVTTLVSVSRGARETNPFLQQVARNPAALFAIKAGAVAGTIVMLEKVRKERPVLAVASLVAINATLAVVAVNNVSVAARQQTR